MSENEDLIPIGTLYVTVDRDSVYILERIRHKQQEYCFTRIGNNFRNPKVWEAEFGFEKGVKGVFYYLKEHSV